MAHKRTSSVADLKAMFENASKKQEVKPIQKVTTKRHSKSAIWENKFKTKQAELINGPRKQYQEWEAANDETKINISIQTNPGILDHSFGENNDDSVGPINRPKKKIIDWNPKTEETKIIKPTINKLVLPNDIREKLNVCLSTDSKQDQEDNVKEEMMTCDPELVIPPQLPQQPKKDARAYFSDQWIGPNWAIPYDTTGPHSIYGDYVGEGSYPRNCQAFPNASRGTFDAIAIDSNTRVILWAKENFQGDVLLDVTGPILINNVYYKTTAPQLMTDTFQDAEIERNYPPSVRTWSETNMHSLLLQIIIHVKCSKHMQYMYNVNQPIIYKDLCLYIVIMFYP